MDTDPTVREVGSRPIRRRRVAAWIMLVLVCSIGMMLWAQGNSPYGSPKEDAECEQILERSLNDADELARNEDHDRALSVLNGVNCLHDWVNVPDELILRYYNLKGDIYLEMGQDSLALAAHISGHKRVDKPGHRHSITCVRNWRKAGDVQMYSYFDTEVADSFYKLALSEITKLNGYEAADEEATLMRNGAEIYISRGDWSRARVILTSILKKISQLSSKSISRVYLSLGKVYHQIELYDSAIICNKKALANLDEKEMEEIHTANTSIANGYIASGRYPEAMAVLEECMEVLAKDSVSARNLLADILRIRGDLYLFMVDEFTSAEETDSLLHLSKLYFKKSIHAYLQAEERDRGMTANAYQFLAYAYLVAEEPDSSLEVCRQAIQMICPEFTSDLPEANPASTVHSFSDEFLAIFIMYKSEAFGLKARKSGWEKKWVDLMMSSAKLADSIISKRQDHVRETDSRMINASGFSPDYDRLVYTLHDAWKATGSQQTLESAFFFAEKGRAALLRQNEKLQTIMGSDSLSPELKARDRALSRELMKVKNDLNTSKGSTALLIHKLDSLENEKDSVALKSRGQAEKQDNLRISDEVPALEAVRKKLDDSTALIEYCFIERTGSYYAFIFTSKKSALVHVPGNALTDSLMDSYLNKISVNPRTWTETEKNRFPAEIRSQGNLLFRLLIGDPIQSMQGSEHINRLILIPDGNLSYLPFESLPLDSVGPGKYGPFLGEKFATSYSFSASRLFLKKSSAGKNFMHSMVMGFTPADSLEESPYPDLAAAEREIQCFGIQSPDTLIFKGTEARKDSFTRYCSQSGFIHLALHAEADTGNASEPKLIFRPGKDSASQYLSLREVYNLDLPHTQLAVLSACQTGIGKTMDGEGVLSLAHGFTYAGANAVVMTLWKVDDQKMADISCEMYAGMQAGLDKDIALKNARKRFLENSGGGIYRHPYFWAGAVLIGNREAISLVSAPNWYSSAWFLSLAGGSLFVFLLLIIKRLRS